MRSMRSVGATAIAVAVLGLGLAGCGHDSGGGGEAKASATQSEESVDSLPAAEPTDDYPDTPEGRLDKKADEEGWAYEELYDSASEYVADMCVSMTDQKRIGTDPGEWLAVAQSPSADEKEILRAGMPSMCPKWSKTALAAIGGHFTRTYSNGTYRVTAHPAKEDPSKDVQDIAPGTYRTSGDLANCYWERTTKSGQIIDNNFATSAQSITVTIAVSDGQFTTRDCGTWRQVK
ncbi:hypothetical protein [Streptomyces sp. NPDC059916]|uniref:hypothetical protein n=1 Tax=Streptomyces sp. NPDC059916 TaxID=3347001 RepID=UPI003677FB4B